MRDASLGLRILLPAKKLSPKSVPSPSCYLCQWQRCSHRHRLGTVRGTNPAQLLYFGCHGNPLIPVGEVWGAQRFRKTTQRNTGTWHTVTVTRRGAWLTQEVKQVSEVFGSAPLGATAIQPQRGFWQRVTTAPNWQWLLQRGRSTIVGTRHRGATANSNPFLNCFFPSLLEMEEDSGI